MSQIYTFQNKQTLNTPEMVFENITQYKNNIYLETLKESQENKDKTEVYIYETDPEYDGVHFLITLNKKTNNYQIETISNSRTSNHIISEKWMEQYEHLANAILGNYFLN